MLRAFVCLVQADHQCPDQASFDCPAELHLQAYWPALQAAAAEGGSGSGGREFLELAIVLHAYAEAAYLGRARSISSAQLAHRLVEQLCHHDCRAAISRQLQQLAAGEESHPAPAVSVEQLHEACACHLHRAAARVCSPGSNQRDSEEVQEVARFATCALRLLSYESMKRIEFETDHLVPGSDSLEDDLHRLLRGYALAQQHRSDFWQCRFAVLALNYAGTGTVDLPPPLLARVAYAFQQAQAAFRRCSRLLPDGWLTAERAGFQLGQTLLPSVLARAQLGRKSSRSVAAHAEFKRTLGQMRGELNTHLECPGCGEQAVALRACSRCRTARYCSRECQAAHWPQHKRECKPALLNTAT